MKDRFYFLCPKCKKLSKYFFGTWKQINKYTVTVTKGDIEPDFQYLEKDVLDEEHIRSECPKCGAVSECYTPEEFLVEVKDGKIKPYGDYWLDHKDELKELVLKDEIPES